MNLDSYYNSDNLQSDGHDAYVERESEKWKKELFRKFYDDFERFPLPISFDPHEEQKLLYFRSERIKEITSRMVNIANIRHHRQYISKS